MTHDVIDFTKKRKEMIEKKRDSFERVVFDHFLGCKAQIHDPSGKARMIDLLDVSRTGCRISVYPTKGETTLKVGEEILLRLYFTPKAYIPAPVKIRNIKQETGVDGLVMNYYGCEFDKTTSSWAALHSFIEFVYRFAEHSVSDRPQQKVQTSKVE